MNKSNKKIIVAPEGLKDIGELQKQYLEELHGTNIEILTQRQASEAQNKELISNNIFLLESLPIVAQKKEFKTSRGKSKSKKTFKH